MILLRKPCSGSSPATYPTYFPFIRVFLRARPQNDGIEQRAVPNPVCAASRQLVFTAPLPDPEALCSLVIHALRSTACGRRARVRPRGGPTGCLRTEGDRAHTAAMAAWRDVEQA